MQGLIGDDNETTALLHSIAEKYVELGQSATAVSLLRRAVVHLHSASSVSHQEGMLQAAVRLAATLVDAGELESGLAQYATVASFALPHGAPPGAAAAIASIRQLRKDAAAAAAALLRKHGRDREAADMSAAAAAATTA